MADEAAAGGGDTIPSGARGMVPADDRRCRCGPKERGRPRLEARAYGKNLVLSHGLALHSDDCVPLFWATDSRLASRPKRVGPTRDRLRSVPPAGHQARDHTGLRHGSTRHPAEAGDPRGRGQVRRVVFVFGRHETELEGRQGDRIDLGGRWHLSRLHAGRALHLAAQDPADEQLHLRLPLLHQPEELERAPGSLHGAGGRAAHPGLLPAQLHRGTVCAVRGAFLGVHQNDVTIGE